MLINEDLGEKWKDPDILKEAELDEETISAYEKVFQKDTTFWQRLGRFIRAENRAGRYAKAIKDFALIFVPYGRTIATASEMATEIITDKQRSNMSFSDKLKKVRNWISWNDKDGNFSWTELGKSVLKIAIPAGIVYGLQYLGLWEAVSQLL